jgi:hypothetical protein
MAVRPTALDISRELMCVFYFIIANLPHPKFQRAGCDLFVTEFDSLNLSVSES